MKSFSSTITFITLILVAFIFSCQEKPKHFIIDAKRQETVHIYHAVIEDEKGSVYDLFACNNYANYFTKLYLLKDQQCLDSMYLAQDSPSLLKFEALPSKKKIHAIYTFRSSLDDPSEQAIITVKDQKIVVPLTLHHKTDIESYIGTGSLDILNEMYSLNEIDLKLLDAKNQCVVKFEEYEKMYDRKTKKFKTERDKGTFNYHYDPNTQAFCDSVKYLDVPYMDCHGQKKRLKGLYPVRDYGKYAKTGLYFTVFVGREWHTYMHEFLMPESDPCYALMNSYQ